MLGYDYDNPHDDRSSFDPADDVTIRTGPDSISNTNARSSLSFDNRSYDSSGTKSLQFQIDDYLEKDVGGQPLRDTTSLNVRVDNLSIRDNLLRDLSRNQGPQGASAVLSSTNNTGMLLSQPSPQPQPATTTALSSSSSSSLSLKQPSHQSSDHRSKPIDDSDDEFSPIRRSHSHTITTATTTSTSNNNNPSNNNRSNNNNPLKNGSILNLASISGPLSSVSVSSTNQQLNQQSGSCE